MRFKSLLVLGFLGAQFVVQGGELKMERVANLDLAPDGIERLAFAPTPALLLSTDSKEQEIHLHHAASNWNNPKLDVVDAFPLTDDVKGIPVPGRPMVVAVHPTQPLALALSRPRDVRARSEVLFLDLREKTAGRLLRSQLVGYQSTHLAITPDGNWAIIANKAEGHRRTPGSIGILDLRTLDVEADRLQEAPYRELPALAEQIGVPEGRMEPGFVAIDEQGRFAAVTFHRNDAIAWLDLRSGEPALAGVMKLPADTNPTGVSLLDEPDGSILVAVAATGAQRIDFYRVGLTDSGPSVQALSSVDVRPFVDPKYPSKRRDPESVLLMRLGGRPVALAASVRTDRNLLFDLQDPAHPRFSARVASAAPAQDFLALKNGGQWFVATANGQGSITILRIYESP